MVREKTNHLVIETPEGVSFSLLLAGPMTRFLAWMIDLLCVSVIGSVVGTVLGFLKLISMDLAEAFITLAYFLISIGYGILTEWFWRGQTLGKRLLKLRVVDEQGLKLHFSQVVTRNLLRFVDMLPAFYLVGGLASVLTAKGQRLGDLAANTVVVRVAARREPDLDQLLAGKFNSFRPYPHLGARLRQRVSPAEAAVALQSLLRRDGLEPQARLRLFSEVSAHFKALVPFPQEALEGLSDEQYVRNVVDVLYNNPTSKL